MKPSADYRLRASSGLHDEHRFVPFLRHLGLFPVASELPLREDSNPGARRFIEEQGVTLLMEVGHTIRYGELGKTFLYLPDAVWSGRTTRLSVKPIHFVAFTTALLALFASFWWVRRPLLGAVSAMLFASNPFQRFEVYGNENVFSWNITAAMLVLALHLPLIFGRPRRAYWIALPLVTGLLLATIRQVRTEPVLIGASALLAYLMIGTWRQRVFMSVSLAVTFVLISSAWSRWFDARWDEAQQVVARAGGHPFPGERERHHLVWHPIWCGLGDFGEDKGYRWDDRIAAVQALPILKTKYGVDVPPFDPKSYVFDEQFLDPARKYYRVPYLLPHYSEVLRDQIVRDVASDPLWYARILVSRLWRILSETTPIFGLPVHGIVAVAIAGVCLSRRRSRRRLIAFFAFPLTLSATALLIFSGRGVTYYGCFHLLPSAVLLAALLQYVLAQARRVGVRAVS